MKRQRDTIIQVSDEGLTVSVRTGAFQGSIILKIEGQAPTLSVVFHMDQEQVEELIEALRRH
jgi:hypothetical protein